jgi:YrbI family 3-deoxy-D-manno-octulosonate 8-phosphate phosphatase
MKVKWWRRGLRTRIANVRTVVVDIDGVLTDGSIFWTESGRKFFKMFGPDDHDAIKRARFHDIDVLFTSSDRPGFEISRARVEYMGGELVYSDSVERAYVMRDECGVDLSRALYIGDGYYDDVAMEKFGVSACPSDAWPGTMRAADIVSSRPGGRRAVAEILHYVVSKQEWGVMP